MRRRLLLAVLLLVLLAVPRAQAEQNKLPATSPAARLMRTGFIGGPVTTGAVAGHHVYVGMGASMAILDVADPTHTRRLGGVILTGQVVQIAVQGRYAYVLSKDGLHIVDVGNPAFPAKVGFVALTRPLSLTLTDKYAFVVDDNKLANDRSDNSVAIVDIGNPIRPQIAVNWSVRIDSNIAVGGQYAYFAQGRELWVVDLSNIRIPTKVGSVKCCGLLSDIKVAVVGNFVYLSFGIGFDVQGVYGAFDIVDVSNPAQPIARGSEDLGYNTRVSMIAAGNRLYVWLQGGDLSGLYVYDASAPDTLTKVSSYHARGPAWLAVDQDRLYLVLTADQLLELFDMADPAEPKLLGRYATIGQANDVVAVGDHAYVAQGELYNQGAGGLGVVSLASPDFPVVGHAVDMTGWAISTYDNDLFLTTGNCSGGKENYCTGEGARLSLDPPTQPALAGSLSELGMDYINEQPVCGRTVVAMNRAYVPSCYFGLHIFDLANPAAPVNLGQYIGSGEQLVITSLALSGHVAYLSAFDEIYILDVAEPKAVREVGRFPFKGRLTKHGNYLYAGDNTDGLVILDLADPARPTEVGRFQVADDSMLGDVVFVEDYAVVLGSKRLYLVDLADPKHPREVDRFIFNVPGQRLAGADGKILVTHGAGGISIFALGEPRVFLPLISR